MIQLIMTHIVSLVIYFVPTFILIYLINLITGSSHEIDTVFLVTLIQTFITLAIGYPAYLREEEE